jgi:hypothetical protein
MHRAHLRGNGLCLAHYSTVMETASVGEFEPEVEGQEVGLATQPKSQSQQAHHQAETRLGILQRSCSDSEGERT